MKSKSIDVIIPILNEEEQIGKTLESVYKFTRKKFSKYAVNIIVGDCGSTDNSKDITNTKSKKYKNISYYNTGIYGRGRVLDHLWKESESDYVIYMDADLSTDLDHLIEMVKKLEEGYDFVIGSRNHKDSVVTNRTLFRTVISKGYALLIRMTLNAHFTDAQCGFKGASTSSYKKLAPLIEDNSWFWDTETLVLAQKTGMKIHTIGVKWEDDPSSTVNVWRTSILDTLGLLRMKVAKIWLKLDGNVNKV